MVITERVKSQFFVDASNEQSFIRIAQANVPVKPKRNGLPWSADEHDRFLSALEAYPSGPWKVIASFVGTRTTRQTMTHAQKYREKIARMKRNMNDQVPLAVNDVPRRQRRISSASAMPLKQPIVDDFGGRSSLDSCCDSVNDAIVASAPAPEPLPSISTSHLDFPLSCTDVDEMYHEALQSFVNMETSSGLYSHQHHYHPNQSLVSVDDELWRFVHGHESLCIQSASAVQRESSVV